MEEDLIKILIENGMTDEEAWQAAGKEIESMGMIKIIRGNCPLNARNPISCVFCHFGHMTECHHPYSCKEAKCSHYKIKIGAEGI